MGIESLPESESPRFRRLIGEVLLAVYFATAPSTVPDWRADPAMRTVAVFPVGEPVLDLAFFQRR